METIYRRVAFVLFLVPMLLAPVSLFAQGPFDGTWRTHMDQSKLSPIPIVFSVKKGMYDCSSCVPQKTGHRRMSPRSSKAGSSRRW
jgi:hypothetical protein